MKEIPLPNTHGKVVAKVVEFCEHYQTESMAQLPKVPELYSITEAHYNQVVRTKSHDHEYPAFFSYREFPNHPAKIS